MRKVINSVFALLVVALFAFTLASCSTKIDNSQPVSKEDIKIGLICLHDQSSTYDANFIDSMKKALSNLGISEDQLELVTGIGEDNSCYEKACELAKTCNFVFADSFGHEDFIIQAAKKYTNVNFAHATGTKAHTEKLDNYMNAFASIYEGRYVAGIVAGMKLNEMIANKKITAEEAIVGYVGAYPYAEVKSGYTSFYLGVKSVCASATMKVRFTNSWYDFDKEKEAANALITTDKCVLISQHADSYGAPEACEKAGVPNVSYNGSTAKDCPNTFLVSSKIDWAPYFEFAITQTLNGEKLTANGYDYTGTFVTGSVAVTELGTNVAQGTQEAVDAAIAKFKAGTLNVFNTANFTVKGAKLTTYVADVDDMGDYVGETEVVDNTIGVFQESKFRSAPYFDVDIDRITILNN